jgi:hypothetical protein
MDSAQTLFSLIDHELDRAAKAITNKVFSESRDLPWTPEQRKRIRPVVRQELELAIQVILGPFDNVGGVLPDDVAGWTIHDSEKGMDIREGNIDYADMWIGYLLDKRDRSS